jgi:methylmalonyl-CoA mutase
MAGFADAGTTVACLCGTDQDYAGPAAGLVAELRAAGATAVWLAGPPDLELDGVDGYVYSGCDALAALRSLHEQLGVQA